MKIRQSVGVFLKDRLGKFLILRVEINKKVDGKIVGKEVSWDIPKGGIESGESKVQALIRELKEEINTDNIANIKELDHTFYFDFPDDIAKNIGFKGQEVYLFSADFKGNEKDIKVDNDEISGFKFLNPEEFLKQLTWETTKKAFRITYQ